jgi:hypothetical protein
MENLPALKESEIMHIWNKATQSYDIIDLRTGNLVSKSVELVPSAGTEFHKATADIIANRIREG